MRAMVGRGSLWASFMASSASCSDIYGIGSAMARGEAPPPADLGILKDCARRRSSAVADRDRPAAAGGRARRARPREAVATGAFVRAHLRVTVPGTEVSGPSAGHD